MDRISPLRAHLAKLPCIDQALLDALCAAIARTPGGEGGSPAIARHYAGPILCLYTWWLMRDAAEKGVSDLHFLARDGEILLDIARVFQRSGLITQPIRLHYLHASRRSWFAPSLISWQAELIAHILDETPSARSADGHARRLGFSDLAALCAHWQIEAATLTVDLDPAVFARHLHQAVPEALAMPHFNALRDTLRDYLAENGLTPDSRHWAVVDLGWRGRMHKALARVLGGPEHDTHGRCYYFALLERPAAQATIHRHALRPVSMLAEDDNQLTRRLPAPASLIELLCPASHGTTTAYTRGSDGHIQPKFQPGLDETLPPWGIEDYRATVNTFAAAFARQWLDSPAAGAASQQHLAHLAFHLTEYLFRLPPLVDARILAASPYLAAETQRPFPQTAAAASLGDAWRWLLSRGKYTGGSLQDSHWPLGSIARCCSSLPFRIYRAIRHNARQRCTFGAARQAGEN